MQLRFRRRCRCAEFWRAILRLVRYEPGDVIVREGDYGNSAFLILEGTVRVVTRAARSEVAWVARNNRSGGWLRAIAQLWQNSRLPEVRSKAAVDRRATTDTHIRDEDGIPRVFVQDVPRLLSETGTANLPQVNFLAKSRRCRARRGRRQYLPIVEPAA